EAPAVPDGVARRARLDLRDVRDQLERRLEVVRAGVLLERIEAVDRYARPDHVEMRGRVAEQRGAVGGMDDQTGMGGAEGLHPCHESPELLGEERVAGLVGGG